MIDSPPLKSDEWLFVQFNQMSWSSQGHVDPLRFCFKHELSGAYGIQYLRKKLANETLDYLLRYDAETK